MRRVAGERKKIKATQSLSAWYILLRAGAYKVSYDLEGSPPPTPTLPPIQSMKRWSILSAWSNETSPVPRMIPSPIY